MAQESYVPTGTHFDSNLSDSDMSAVNYYKQQWEYANSIGDQAGMDNAHAAAERIRAQNGYSGGADGSEYNPLASSLYPTGLAYSPYSSSSSSKAPQYTGSTISSATSAANYINGLYAAREASALNALKSAYDQNVLKLDAEGEKIPLEYRKARNQASSQSELQRANFNEFAAGRGLNSGTGGQAHLAMGNALQNSLSGISQAEANAMSSLALQRASLEIAYKNDVAQAISEGNIARAQALYDDYVRVDNSLVAASQAQADENYRTWKANYDTYTSLMSKQTK